MTEMIGRIIENKYRLDTELGVGGMGLVYRATRLLIGDDVAVKILNSTLVSDEQAAERFRREAQAAARLKHPNVVTVYDFGITSDGLTYLVMELVEGESLRQIIKKRGPLTSPAASEIITQVCAALDEAHRQQIIHRDIKPDNIIVNNTASGLRVKVLDFGIAKLRDPAASNLTQTGSVMGTPHYMSPEQCIGEDLDNRSDIYSLGIVLFEMLCGVVPFNSPTSTAVVIQHVNQPPPPLHLLNASISPDVESVIFHALEKRREARPQTAGELAKELRAAVSGTSSANYQWQTSQSSAPVTDQRRGRSPTLVMSTSPSGSHLYPSHAVNPEVARGPRSSARIVFLTALVTVLLLGLGGGGAWLFFREQNHEGANVARNDSKRDDSIRSNNNGVRLAGNTDISNDELNATPIATPSPSFVTSAAQTDIVSIMNQWADSLGRQDLEDNLKFYADHLDTFYQLYDVDKEKVRASRQTGFSRYYSSVNIQLSDINVELDASSTTATVSYDSTYDWRGGTRFLTGKSRNEMTLSSINGEWRITSEKHIHTYYEEKGN